MAGVDYRDINPSAGVDYRDINPSAGVDYRDINPSTIRSTGVNYPPLGQFEPPPFGGGLKSVTERVLTLDALTQRLATANTRLHDLLSAMGKHADSIFGGVPTGETVGGSPSVTNADGRINGLATCISTTDALVDALGREFSRFKDL